MNRLCEICGAKVTNSNKLTTTCDSLCTRAKKNGLSRAGQIKRDIALEKRDERLGYWPQQYSFNRR